MLQPVVASLQEDRSPGLASLIDDVWPLLQHTLGAPNLTQQQVLAAASAAISRIQEVVCEQDAAAAEDAAAALEGLGINVWIGVTPETCCCAVSKAGGQLHC